jgi:hypothetical protein
MHVHRGAISAHGFGPCNTSNSVIVGIRDGVTDEFLVIGLDSRWSLPHDGKKSKNPK